MKEFYLIKSFPHKGLLLVAMVSSLFVACGTEQDSLNPSVVSYDGMTLDASLTSENSQAILRTAAEAMTKSVDAYNANTDATEATNPFAAIATAEGDSDALQQLLYHITKQATQQKATSNIPIAAVIPSSELATEFCGGSITVPDTFVPSSDLNGTFIFNKLCYNNGVDGELIVNGSIAFTETSTTLTMRFNISITRNGNVQNLNATFSCKNGNCSFYSDYVGTDSKTYRVADVIVTETNGSYTISASFYHPDYGKVSVITSNPLTFNCENGYPGSGTLNFTSAADDSVATLTFNDCAGYGYNYTISGGGPVSETGLW